MVTTDLIKDTVIKAIWRLSRITGMVGTDSTSLYHWLLRFGETNSDLRQILAELAEYLANNIPPLVRIMGDHVLLLDHHSTSTPECSPWGWKKLGRER